MKFPPTKDGPTLHVSVALTEGEQPQGLKLTYAVTDTQFQGKPAPAGTNYAVSPMQWNEEIVGLQDHVEAHFRQAGFKERGEDGGWEDRQEVHVFDHADHKDPAALLVAGQKALAAIPVKAIKKHTDQVTSPQDSKPVARAKPVDLVALRQSVESAITAEFGPTAQGDAMTLGDLEKRAKVKKVADQILGKVRQQLGISDKEIP